jgi:PAS domain S-box-containing protein
MPAWLGARGDEQVPQACVFQRMREPAVVIDADSCRVRLWNAAAEAVFGFSAAEILGQPVGCFISDLPAGPRWERLLVSAAPEALAGRAVPQHGHTREGAALQLEVSFSLMEEAADGERLALLVIRDVTDRQRPSVEERLRAALARQRFLDDATSALAISLDYATTLQAVARLPLGRLADACIVQVLDDERCVEAQAAAHVDPVLDADLQAVAADASSRRGTARGRVEVIDPSEPAAWDALGLDEHHARLLRSFQPGSAVVVPLLGRGRVLGSMLMVSAEVDAYPTERVCLAEDLARRCALALESARLYDIAQQAIAARDQFLSIASHELRAPLARIKSHAEILLMADADPRGIDPRRLAWSARRISAAVDRLAALTTDVLDVSRLRGGQIPFRARAVDLCEVVADLEVQFADQLGDRHPLVLDVSHEPCPVLIDQDRLEQIVANLLDNASKYSPDGGDVRLRVERVSDGVLLSVHDHGVGLPPGAEELIFEPFGRASNAEQGNVPGMGLGLHVCRLIVQRHGGRIWAVSDGENAGTTVTVWLPFAEASTMRADDLQTRLTNQLTLAAGYCELLANNPDLPDGVRAQALEAFNGAHGAAETLADLL